MFASKNSLLALSLALVSGSFAAPEGICKRALGQPAGTPTTVFNLLPTKSISSPPDDQCPVTYTTIISSLCSNAGGTPTGLSDHTYTMTFRCQGSEDSACSVNSNPEACPPRFTKTTTICEKCAGGPVTYTLTVPEQQQQAAITGQPSEGSEGSPENPPPSAEVGQPSSNPEAQATEAIGNAPSGPNADGGEGGGGNASGAGAGESSSSPSKAIEVSSSAGLSIKGHVTRLLQISFLTAIFVGTWT